MIRMERIASHNSRSLFMNAVILELRIFRAIGRTLLNFFADLGCFVLGLDLRKRREED